MLAQTKPSEISLNVPFDADRLDRLMEEAGLDVLVVTSKHNVQYLLGRHRAFFFDYMDAMGLSRYLPVFIYVKGALEKAAYVGHRLEGFQSELKPFWVATSHRLRLQVRSTPWRRRSPTSVVWACRCAELVSKPRFCSLTPAWHYATLSRASKLPTRSWCWSGSALAKALRNWKSIGSPPIA